MLTISDGPTLASAASNSYSPLRPASYGPRSATLGALGGLATIAGNGELGCVARAGLSAETVSIRRSSSRSSTHRNDSVRRVDFRFARFRHRDTRMARPPVFKSLETRHPRAVI